MTEKVYCKDCKWKLDDDFEWCDYRNEFTGTAYFWRDRKTAKNGNGDCQDFERRPPSWLKRVFG